MSQDSSWWDVAHKVFDALRDADLSPDDDGVVRAVVHMHMSDSHDPIIEIDSDHCCDKLLLLQQELAALRQPVYESDIPVDVWKHLK